MMRGISYDDNYIARKMNSLADPIPAYSSHVAPYGYSQTNDPYNNPEETRIMRGGDPLELTSENIAPPVGRPGFVPSARTQLILNRVALSQPRGFSPSPRGYLSRPTPPPPMYDYDYGYAPSYGGYGGYRPYGCGYGYAYPPPPPLQRYRNFDTYLDDEYDMNYVPRYRPSRLSDALVELEKEKLRRSVSPVVTRTTTTATSAALPSTDYLAKHFSPGMLHDQVDKMRTRLQAMSYSLDPPGQGHDPAYEDKSRYDSGKKYSSGPKHLACVEFAGGAPQWKRKAMMRYPKEDPNNLSELSRIELKEAEDTAEKEPQRLILKDRLSMRIHKYLSDTLAPDKYEKYLKNYRNPDSYCGPLPTYSSKMSSGRAGDDSSRWEEPGTVYTRPSDTKCFSKASEGEEDDQKKERRRKKKSKERDEPLPIESSEGTGATVNGSTTPGDSGVAVSDATEAELDEKEKKKLEKKKKKAEREAAAKAAMEAELAALAEAEAELARLEAESAGIKAPQELVTESSVLSPAATEASEPKTEPKPEVTEVAPSEEVTEKCESTKALSPECKSPVETECQPSILSSSKPNVVAEESLQDHVDAASDLSQNQVLESEEQVIETEPERESTEKVAVQPEIFSGRANSQSHAPEMKDGEPIFTNETIIWDDSDAVNENTVKEQSPASAEACDDTQAGDFEENDVQPKEDIPVAVEEEVEEEIKESNQSKVYDTIIPEENEVAQVDAQESCPSENNSKTLEIEEKSTEEEYNYDTEAGQKTSNDEQEKDLTQPAEESEEAVNISQMDEQSMEGEQQQSKTEEEPNLDDVPLDTDVDIFADRDE